MPPSSVNMTLRKVTRNHRIFPSDEAVYKVVYLVHEGLNSSTIRRESCMHPFDGLSHRAIVVVDESQNLAA